MKKWELKDLIDKLEGKIISLQVDNGQLRTKVRNLKERVNRHNERAEELESELSSLRMVELDLSMTDEEYKVYEEGMKILNSEGEMTEEDIEVINSCHCGCPSHQEVREIVLNVIEEAVVEALNR